MSHVPSQEPILRVRAGPVFETNCICSWLSMVRFKNRWLLVELIPAQLDAGNCKLLNSKDIYATLKQSVLNNFGDTGWGTVAPSLTIKYFSPTTNICIIRVARDHHRIVRAAVTLLSSIEERKYIPNVVHISGTIKQVQLAAITHNREVIARYRARAKTPVAYQDSYKDYLQSSTAEIEALQD